MCKNESFFKGCKLWGVKGGVDRCGVQTVTSVLIGSRSWLYNQVYVSYNIKQITLYNYLYYVAIGNYNKNILLHHDYLQAVHFLELNTGHTPNLNHHCIQLPCVP